MFVKIKKDKMVTGVTSAWGYPIQAVGGMSNVMVNGNHPLTYELGMSSYPPTFKNGQFISPLYSSSPFSAFGKKRKSKSKKTKNVKRFSKKICRLFLKNKSRNPVTGRKLKRGGKTFKKFISECKRHKLIKQKKKL